MATGSLVMAMVHELRSRYVEMKFLAGAGVGENESESLISGFLRLGGGIKEAPTRYSPTVRYFELEIADQVIFRIA